MKKFVDNGMLLRMKITHNLTAQAYFHYKNK